MQTFALDGRFSDISRFSIAKQIYQALIAGGMKLDEDRPDIVICLGGDGSLLRAANARQYTGNFMLLNGGTLGYLGDFRLSDWEKAVYCLLHQTPTFEPHHPLVVEDRNNHHAYAANDVSLVAPVRALNFELFLNQEKLADVQGSGFVMNTALGSTAFSMSLGGPVLMTGDQVFGLSLIAPVRNRVTHPAFNHVVFEAGTTVKVRLEQNSRLYRLAVDGIETNVLTGHELYFYLSKNRTFSIVHYREKSKVHRINQCFGN